MDPKTGQGCSTLYWDVEGVDSVYLNGAGVIGHGSKQVCVGRQPVTYTLTLRCSSGDKAASVTVSAK
jgi:hypothetical protein